MNRNTLKRLAVSFVLASGLVVGGSAFAQTTLAPGGFDSNAGNVLKNHDLNYWHPLDNINSSFSADTFSGVLGSWVTNNANVFIPSEGRNPYGWSDLTFLYQFSNNGKDSIEFLTLTGFAGVQTSVAYSDQMSFTDMASVARSTDGDRISVSWQPNGVAKGSFGELIVYTNSTTYTRTTGFVQDGSNTSATIFAPVFQPVPEPETYAMMLAGLGLMGFIARRRKQNAAA